MNIEEKTIYITENQRQLIKEGILLDKLPEDLMNIVLKGKTSLGNNPAIPNVFEMGYIERVINKRFEETKNELKKIGEIDDVDDTQMETVLNKLILRCQELERPFRNQLEKICFNRVLDFFKVPDDFVQIEMNLVDEVDLGADSIILDPIDGDENLEFDDVVEMESIRDEVYKRRILDVLSMGAGMQISSDIKSYMNEIYDINPKLLDLYRKILALNNYLLFTKEDLGLSDENKMQIGTVEVILGQYDEKVKIKAQGEIFPVLLCETIRGFMELFASHGLPKSKEMAETVIGKSDFLKAEPWDMRLGPSLWTIFSDSFDNVNSDLLPYLYKNVSKLSIDNFNKLLKEVFAKTRKGKRLMAKIIDVSRKQLESDSFDDKMSKLKTDKSIITDEFIHPDEI